MEYNVNVLEFYSGIGGMHYALLAASEEISSITAKVVEAFDINTNANLTYFHNFKKQPKSVRDEEYIWEITYFVLRFLTGVQMGSKDARARSFHHLIDIIGSNVHHPSYILVENVKGFEESDTRDRLVNALIHQGYTYQEFLLSPNQLMIPYSRLRYFLLAKKSPLKFCQSLNEGIHTFIPGCKWMNVQEDTGITSSPGSLAFSVEKCNEQQCRPLEHYLDKEVDGNFLLSESTLLKYGMRLDIVTKESKRCNCFTKGYFSYCEGTGSVIQMADKEVKGIEGDPSSLLPLQLRYFTPKEIARLHGFPPQFAFPDSQSHKQQYKLLGNSLSVDIIRELLIYLLKEP